MYHVVIVKQESGNDPYYNVRRRLDRYFSGYPEDTEVIRGRIRNDRSRTIGEVMLVEHTVVSRKELKEDLEERDINYNISESPTEIEIQTGYKQIK